MMLILYKDLYIFKVNLDQTKKNTKNKDTLFFEMEGVPMFGHDVVLCELDSEMLVTLSS
jgi:hypothetical protein